MESNAEDSLSSTLYGSCTHSRSFCWSNDRSGNITSIASAQASLPNAVYLASILLYLTQAAVLLLVCFADKIGGVRTLLLCVHSARLPTYWRYSLRLTLSSRFNHRYCSSSGWIYGTLLWYSQRLQLSSTAWKTTVLTTACFTRHGVSLVQSGTAVVGYSMTNGDSYGLTLSAAMMAVCIVLAIITKPMSDLKKAAERKSILKLNLIKDWIWKEEQQG